MKFILYALPAIVLSIPAFSSDTYVQYSGYEGPGEGKHIVFVVGDDEYRSEEGMPLMAKILAKHHGFTCTVLFSQDPETGEIDPSASYIPNLELLEDADLMVLFTRFRALPDEQMKHIDEYTHSGKPIVALRTSTHAFNYPNDSDSPYARYTWNNKGDYEGGYGRQVLGETWVAHYGKHNVEATRGVPAPGQEDHPILRGVGDIFGPSDVYDLTTLHGDCTPIVLGKVLVGMNPWDEEKEGMDRLPVAWTKNFTGNQGKTARVFVTTMGHSGDLLSAGTRRMIVNGCYWAMGMEDEIPEKSNVDLIGDVHLTPIGFNTYRTGMFPSDYAMD